MPMYSSMPGLVLLARMMLPRPSTEGEDVPTPTVPLVVTMSEVSVEEPMTNEGPEMPFGFTDKRPHGEVVPTPILPFVSTVKRFDVEAESKIWNFATPPV